MIFNKLSHYFLKLLGRENNEDGFGCCARLIVDLIDRNLKKLNENLEGKEYKLMAVVGFFNNEYFICIFS
jgi:hypothetical protein